MGRRMALDDDEDSAGHTSSSDGDSASDSGGGRRRRVVAGAYDATSLYDAETASRRLLLLDTADTCLMAAFQAWNMLRYQLRSPWSVFILAVCAANAALPLFASRYWLRHRNWILIASRNAILAAPSVRRLDVGLSLVLWRDPEPGSLGAVRDAGRILMGIKTAFSVQQALRTYLPPHAALVTSIIGGTLTWPGVPGVPGYCGTQLLQAPLTRARLKRASGWVETALRGLGLVQGMPGPYQQSIRVTAHADNSEDGAYYTCRVNLYFWHIMLAVVFPLAVSALRFAWGRSLHGASARAAGVGAACMRERVAGALERFDRGAANLLTGLWGQPGVAALLLWIVAVFAWEASVALAGAPPVPLAAAA